jgi:hypothetical protein
MRGWISRTDRRWMMYCDGGCGSRVPTLPGREGLRKHAAEGWFIAKVSGDLCPSCRAKMPSGEPHAVMVERLSTQGERSE